MAHFASGKLSSEYPRYLREPDLEEDSGPAEDEVDGCAVLRQDLCYPAGCSVRKPVEMISRGFKPMSKNNNLLGMGNLFDGEHPMVLSKDIEVTKPQMNKFDDQHNQMKEQKLHAPLKQVKEMEEKYDSCYDSGLTERSFCDSEDYSSTASKLHKTYEHVARQMGNLKISENFSERPNSVAEKDVFADEKIVFDSFYDETYFSEERNPSIQIPFCPTEFMFCDQDKEGDTQAHLLLIHNKSLSFLNLLSCVNNSAFLNVQNFLLQSLLHLSVILNLPEIVRKLIARGADVDVRDRHGNTPLHIACERGYYDCVIALTTPLDHREVKDIPYNLPYQRIPQHPDIKNYNGMTCLHLAAENDHINIVNHLITMCSADINAQEGKGGETILHQAVERSAEDLVKYLLLHRELQLESSRYDGTTALQMAQGYGNHRMINLLVNAGADNSRSSSISDSEDDLMVDGGEDLNLPYDDFRIGGSLITM